MAIVDEPPVIRAREGSVPGRAHGGVRRDGADGHDHEDAERRDWERVGYLGRRDAVGGGDRRADGGDESGEDEEQASHGDLQVVAPRVGAEGSRANDALITEIWPRLASRLLA